LLNAAVRKEVPVRDRPGGQDGRSPNRRRDADDMAIACERPASWQRDLDSVCEHEDIQAGVVTAHDAPRNS
jgi:hypothetical protein